VRAAAGVAGTAVASIVVIAGLAITSGGGRSPDVGDHGSATPAAYLRYVADPTTDPARERHDVVTYSDSPSKPDVGDMVRSCRVARTFPVYALGERFERLDLADATVTCQVPDPPTRDGGVRTGTQSAADLYYGPCEAAGVGCVSVLHVRNRPARAEPHSRYHRPSFQVPHRHVRIAGRRAMIAAGEAGSTVEVYFPRTTVIVDGPARLTRRAAERLAIVGR
jgi:hypothetical protein